jgi:enamine deaminase RidA (YjgF/YER057c/UK114 family)
MNRQLVSSGTKWEILYGYSRAVKVGNIIAVAGTTAVDDAGNIVGENDFYAQAVFIYQKIEKALQQLGASLNNVIRLRIFITDMSRHQEVLEAQGEFFANIRPAATIVEINALIDDKLLVEIEADAVVE